MSNRDAQKQTLVEDGTEFKGSMISRCPVVVNGMVEGELRAPSLTIAKTGTVTGEITADVVKSEGTLAGSLDANTVQLSGTVRSDTIVRAKTLEVRLAPPSGKLEVSFGECVIEVGEDPARTEALTPATVTKDPFSAVAELDDEAANAEDAAVPAVG